MAIIVVIKKYYLGAPQYTNAVWKSSKIIVYYILLIQHNCSVGFFLDDRWWRLSWTIVGCPENDEHV